MKNVAMAIVLVGFMGGVSSAVRAQDDVIASAGQVSVRESDIAALVRPLSAENRQHLVADPSKLDPVVRANLAEKVAFAEAKAKGWDKRPEVQAAIERAEREAVVRSYVTSVVVVPRDYPSDEEIQAAYDGNPAAFAEPRVLHLEQIYIAIPQGHDAAGVNRAREQAADVAKRARAHGADFAALARTKSDDKSLAGSGGDMGFISETELLPEIRQAVDRMKVGEVSSPVQTGDGFHVIRLVDVRAAGPRPLAEVKAQIGAALRQQRQQQDAQAYMQKLAGSAAINEDVLKKALSSTQ
ncbi:MAG TPA: peptidylprolyl isomerase [Paraburkholderia sp.]|jgi:peptidylprolyl isomerase